MPSGSVRSTVLRAGLPSGFTSGGGVETGEGKWLVTREAKNKEK